MKILVCFILLFQLSSCTRLLNGGGSGLTVDAPDSKSQVTMKINIGLNEDVLIGCYWMLAALLFRACVNDLIAIVEFSRRKPKENQLIIDASV